MRAVPGIRLAAIFALFVGLTLAGATQAAAGGVTATIHAMECFSGVGSAIFEECHDNYDTGTSFFENGNGTLTMVIPEEDLAGYLGAYVYCRDLVDDEVLYDGSYADGVTFATENGDDIVCDVYFIKPASSGGSSTSNEVKTTTTLPATGAGTPGQSFLPVLLMAAMLAGLAAFGAREKLLRR